MGWLDITMIHLLAETAIGVPLGREALLAGVSEVSRAQIRRGDTDSQQMLLDLTFLNRQDLPLREIPLRTRLLNAIYQTAEMDAANVFKTALVQLESAASTFKTKQSQTTTPNSAQRVSKSEAVATAPVVSDAEPRSIVFFTASDGASYVDRLVVQMHGLKRAKLATFVRTDDLPVGVDRSDNLRTVFQNAYLIMAIVTPQLLIKDEPLAELEVVAQAGKVVIPVLAIRTQVVDTIFAGKNAYPKAKMVPEDLIKKLRDNPPTLSDLTEPQQETAFAAIAAEMRALLSRPL
ncbi:MAG: hypothetical protein IPK82_17805 [Polyangiaceae bacterium]|nr:hypothetical protein [Polyangiaceae bacterium]